MKMTLEGRKKWLEDRKERIWNQCYQGTIDKLNFVKSVSPNEKIKLKKKLTKKQN